MKSTLKYGQLSAEINIPDKNCRDTLLPRDVEAVSDPIGEVKRALANPIGTRLLKNSVSPMDNVVIVASDISRPSPSHILLPPILEELNEAGVADKQITIVFALGIHRKQTNDEMKKLVGEDIFNRIRCVNHDGEKCVNIGTSKRGTPIEVFKEVVDADFLIATGNIEFHFFAGYSGGAKAVAPGVCSRETVQANHKRSFDDDARVGKIDGNPVREDLDEIGGIIGVDYMVNAILNSQKEIIKVVAGDVYKAHREGISYIDNIFRIDIDDLADIVVISPGGAPKDIDLYQTNKAIENGILALKKGGIIVVCAECRDGLGESLFAEAMTEDKPLDDLIDEIKHDFVLGRHKASRLAHIFKNTEIYLVSSLPDEIKDNIFMKTFDSVQKAFDKALEVQGESAQALVIPYGNSTLPNFPDSPYNQTIKEAG